MSKNQNNSGPQKNDTSKPAKHRVTDVSAAAYEDKQPNARPDTDMGAGSIKYNR